MNYTMTNCIKIMFQKLHFFDLGIRLTIGIVSTIIVAVFLFIVSKYFSLTENLFSLGTNVFINGQVHKLITYSFYHKDISQLLVNVGVLVPLCSGLEKSVGTIRFFFIFLLLSAGTGLLHTLLELLLFTPEKHSQVAGLIPGSLSVMGMSTIHSRMRKAIVMGVSVPTVSLPWILLIFITLLIPHTVFLCNVIAIITGEIYGTGWLSKLEMSETRASVLDKKLPFRLIRKIGILYVPALTEERRKIMQPPCNPSPGSYPVQTYAPASPASTAQANTYLPQMLEGWPHSSYIHESCISSSLFQGYNQELGHLNNFNQSLYHGQSQVHSFDQNVGDGHSHEQIISQSQGYVVLQT